MSGEKKAWFSSVRAKLVLLVLLVLLPLFALALFQNFRERASEQARISERIVALSRLIAAREEGYVKNAYQLLATLASFSPLVRGTNVQFSTVHLQNLLKLVPDYMNFGLIEQDGSVFVSALPLPDPSINLGDRSYFQRAKVSRRFAIGEYQVGRISAQPSLNFGYPIDNEEGSFQRVFFASLKLDLLAEAASGVAIPEGAAITVLDRSGTILARLPEPMDWVGKSAGNIEFVRQVLALKDGTVVTGGLDGIQRLYAVSSISDGQSPSLFVSVGVPTSLVFAEANTDLLKSLVFLTGVSILALLSAKLIAEKTVISPLQDMAGAADRLGGGDLDARANADVPTKELRHVAEAFNGMAERLQERERELKRAADEIRTMNMTLERRVEERTAQLSEAVKELEAFSYSVSHDLRAPLRHIQGFAQMLEQHNGDRFDDKGRRHLGVITDSAKKMGTLIDDLLEFSRMGRQDMLHTPVDLRQLAQEVIAELAPEAGGRAIEWRVGELPLVEGDRAMLRQVLANLFSNALKYTRPKERALIEFDVLPDEGRETIFVIRDNGVGFDARFADKLFGVFQRLHLESEFEGTGIGLANVRRILARHGGRIWAESILGAGASFYFTLPRR